MKSILELLDPKEQDQNREERQLDLLGFPLGFGVGSLIGQILFPVTTTTTTTRTPTQQQSQQNQQQNQQRPQQQQTPSPPRPTQPPTRPDQSPSNSKQFTSQSGCGVSGIQTNRIVGGEAITKHQYPWLCSLKIRGGSHICGVTLLGIHPHVKETILVGAAHCYNRGQRISIFSTELLFLNSTI